MMCGNKRPLFAWNRFSWSTVTSHVLLEFLLKGYHLHAQSVSSLGEVWFYIGGGTALSAVSGADGAESKGPFEHPLCRWLL